MTRLRELPSMLPVIDRLEEAYFFLDRMSSSGPPEYGYYLNAFLSACRSSGDVFQEAFKEYGRVKRTFIAERKALAGDKHAKFFSDLRNVSTHKHRPSIVGGAETVDGILVWSYVFVRGQVPLLPKSLIGVDVQWAALQYFCAIVRLFVRVQSAHPFETDIRKALTHKGMAALQYTVADVADLVGMPKDWFSTKMSTSEMLDFVSRRMVDDASISSCFHKVLEGSDDVFFAHGGGKQQRPGSLIALRLERALHNQSENMP